MFLPSGAADEIRHDDIDFVALDGILPDAVGGVIYRNLRYGMRNIGWLRRFFTHGIKYFPDRPKRI
jgi:hypothetical protein